MGLFAKYVQAKELRNGDDMGKGPIRNIKVRGNQVTGTDRGGDWSMSPTNEVRIKR